MAFSRPDLLASVIQVEFRFAIFLALSERLDLLILSDGSLTLVAFEFREPDGIGEIKIIIRGFLS